MEPLLSRLAQEEPYHRGTAFRVQMVAAQAILLLSNGSWTEAKERVELIQHAQYDDCGKCYHLDLETWVRPGMKKLNPKKRVLEELEGSQHSAKKMKFSEEPRV